MPDNNEKIMINIENLNKNYKMFKNKDTLIETIIPKYEEHTRFCSNKKFKPTSKKR